MTDQNVESSLAPEGREGLAAHQSSCSRSDATDAGPPPVGECVSLALELDLAVSPEKPQSQPAL